MLTTITSIQEVLDGYKSQPIKEAGLSTYGQEQVQSLAQSLSLLINLIKQELREDIQNMCIKVLRSIAILEAVMDNQALEQNRAILRTLRNTMYDVIALP